MSYSTLLTYGDVIPLKITCDVKKLFDEIKDYSFSQYNPRKDIKRKALSITSLDGSINGIDLDSIKEYNNENNTKYDEMSFNQFTKVYEDSFEIQKVVEPFKQYIGRSHILHLPTGGHFPPHRDVASFKEIQPSFRVLIPLKNCNSPNLFFMYENEILNFEHGRAYFVNTNKVHCLFSFSDSYMIVLNILSNRDTYKIIGDNLLFS